MSKKKPSRVFKIAASDGKTVIVLARHAKGALSAARDYGADLPSDARAVECDVDATPASLAINLKT